MVPPRVAFGASPYRGRHRRPGEAGSAVSAFWRWPALIASLLLLTLTATVSLAQDSDTATRQSQTRGVQPLIEKARGGQCVADAAFMRRRHMDLLRHQRDDTMRAGVRNGNYSLKACIACHASQKTQSVNAEAGNFCQSCHAYAAVKIDCFECHTGTAPGALTQGQVKP